MKWACPVCQAPANACGKKPTGFCDSDCMGFICECEGEMHVKHGESDDDPCMNATCYHCGWGGRFPTVPLKLKGWEKKAWDAGWRPPAGWLKEKDQ